ncbi:MAG: hypothetical protein ACXABI_01775 [Candidatus Hodarchaeales archaeon]|jgi:hypothetical protein
MSNVRLKHLILIFLCLHINLLMNQSVVSITNPTMEINKSNNLSQMVTNLSVLVVLMELPDDPHHPSHTVHSLLVFVNIIRIVPMERLI